MRRRNTLKSFIYLNRGITGQTGTEMKHTIDRDPTNTKRTGAFKHRMNPVNHLESKLTYGWDYMNS